MGSTQLMGSKHSKRNAVFSFLSTCITQLMGSKHSKRKAEEERRRAQEQLRKMQAALFFLALRDAEHKKVLNKLREEMNKKVKDMDFKNLKVRYDAKSKELLSKKDEYEKLYQQYGTEMNKYSQKMNDLIKEGEESSYYETMTEDDAIKQIILLGKTGGGKSTFGNRLSGDQSQWGNDERFFMTKNSSKETEKIIVRNLHQCDLAVIDSPGRFDPDKNDDKYANNMVAYLRACGGINAFVIVQKNDRLDSNIQEMLQDLGDVFGAEFWNHIIFVFTNVENRAAEEWNSFKAETATKIKEKLSNIKGDPIIVGVSNYFNYRRPIREEFIPSIFDKKIQCKGFTSPYEQHKEGLCKQETALQNMIFDLQKKANYIQVIKTEIDTILDKISTHDPGFKAQTNDDIQIPQDSFKLYQNQLAQFEAKRKQVAKCREFNYKETDMYDDAVRYWCDYERDQYWIDSQMHYIQRVIGEIKDEKPDQIITKDDIHSKLRETHWRIPLFDWYAQVKSSKQPESHVRAEAPLKSNKSPSSASMSVYNTSFQPNRNGDYFSTNYPDLVQQYTPVAIPQYTHDWNLTNWDKECDMSTSNWILRPKLPHQQLIQKPLRLKGWNGRHIPRNLKASLLTSVSLTFVQSISAMRSFMKN